MQECLLPKEVDEEGNEQDPRAELVEQLLQYKLFKAMAEELKGQQVDAAKAYFRKPDIPKEVSEYTPPVDLNEVIGDINLIKLNAIFADVMKRKEDKVDPVRSKFGKIEKEEVTMSEKLVDIKAFMMEHKTFSFRGAAYEGGFQGSGHSDISCCVRAYEDRIYNSTAGRYLRGNIYRSGW